MDSLNTILTNDAQLLIQTIKDNMSASGIDATGKTAAALDFEIVEEGDLTTLNILGNPFTQVIETGRKATPDKKPSSDMIANLTEWVDARGIDEKAVWGIATNIQKEGTKLYQSGGRTDIYSEPFDKWVDTLQKDVLENFEDTFTKLVLESYGSHADQ